MTAAQRVAFAALADVLLPAVDGLPSPSAVGVGGRWLDLALAARADLTATLAAVLDAAQDRDPAAEARRLHEQEPAAFAVLGLLASGAYYMHPRVRKAIGYPGQRADPAADDEADWFLRDGLLDPVVARGPIWREA